MHTQHPPPDIYCDYPMPDPRTFVDLDTTGLLTEDSPPVPTDDYMWPLDEHIAVTLLRNA